MGSGRAATVAWLCLLATTAQGRGAAPARGGAASAVVALVQRQVDRFNAGDLDGFVACYADDVEVFALGGATAIPPLRGRDAFVARYRPMMEQVRPHVAILSRMVNGAFVVDKERTTGGGRTEEGIAVYQVEGGRIRRVWFTP